MKDPKRYALMGNPWEMVQHKNGNLVSYEDYAALKRRFEICEEYAEGLERFIKSEAADIKRLKEERDNLDKQLNEEINKSAMLCGQIMRLTEAGDSMAAVITQYRCSPWGRKVPNAFTVWDAWFAAKKGDKK
jgi:hypothetical protein